MGGETVTVDEAYELENFFKKGIETIAGQRARIKELEQKLTMCPVVWCASCERKMETFRDRDHQSITDYDKGAHREVAYRCPNRHCHTVVWVRKLRHPLEAMRT